MYDQTAVFLLCLDFLLNVKCGEKLKKKKKSKPLCTHEHWQEEAGFPQHLDPRSYIGLVLKKDIEQCVSQLHGMAHSVMYISVSLLS